MCLKKIGTHSADRVLSPLIILFFISYSKKGGNNKENNDASTEKSEETVESKPKEPPAKKVSKRGKAATGKMNILISRKKLKGEQNFFPVSTSQSAISVLLEIWSNN